MVIINTDKIVNGKKTQRSITSSRSSLLGPATVLVAARQLDDVTATQFEICLLKTNKYMQQYSITACNVWCSGMGCYREAKRQSVIKPTAATKFYGYRKWLQLSW